nr:uncharacterized protein LOC111962526 isoform X2 [Salvelinus alpinus]
MQARRVTVHRISKTITLYLNDTASPKPSPGPLSALNDAASTSPSLALTSAPTKPLLLMLPWLGSRPQAVAKYCEIYFRTGFDVLIVESAVSQFLWPRWGLDYGARVLDLLQSDLFVSRPLLVHAFSIGGYTFTQLLVHVSRDTQKYCGFTQRIRGHIYDSLVLGSLERMATGLERRTVRPGGHGGDHRLLEKTRDGGDRPEVGGVNTCRSPETTPPGVPVYLGVLPKVSWYGPSQGQDVTLGRTHTAVVRPRNNP